ncbi:biopolymer transport protein ExbD [Lutimaribacter pacificus]|uniref:Outer membrane transport energization protein ExbD n=2 Tax=Lutimaribacter pacificus TaxID=391948 RepID=A0A1H0D4W6_9RHOB|nr:biopolymer transport protein ExbD [Lutimaribacter pacificus]SHJ36780.1 outer membrane transport energization protein ExbD [Lutimaribacter pacificus]
MTSLIDVIFLLLLFFMLSSTFTRFAEIELATGGAGSGAAPENPVFISLAPDRLRLNGAESTVEALAGALDAHRAGDAPLTVLIAMQGDVTAQRLTDLLSALRSLPQLRVTVLEAT